MKINKKLKSLISVLAIFVLLTGAGLILKNILLHQIEKKIKSSFGYSRLHLSFFPPSLILEEARNLSLSPFFSAKKIDIRISLKSLLRKNRPLRVVIDQPILRIYSLPSKIGKKKFAFSFPFAIEKGLIKNGEFYFWGKKDRFHARGINALFSQKKAQFLLKAEAEENLFYLASAEEYIEGRVSVWLEGRGEEIDIKRIIVAGQDGILKAEGRLIDPFHPKLRLKTFLRAPMPLIAKFLSLPFTWEGKVEARGNLVRNKDVLGFRGVFSSQRLVLNRVQIGRVRGKVDFNERKGGLVEFNIRKKTLPQEFVRINFKRDRVWGTIRRFHLDPIMNYVSLPWPIYSPAWGNFSLDSRNLIVDGEFRDEAGNEESSRFPLNGHVKFNWDKKSQFSFSSDELESSFAHIKIEGKARINQNIDISLQGKVKDLKQARQFTSLILNKKFDFPEIRGEGQAELQIFGDYKNPQIESKFAFSPGGFDKFEANSVQGEAKIINGDFWGKFNVDDPFLKGKITLSSNRKELNVAIQAERGAVETIFPALDINLPFKGEASGNFEIRQRGEENLQVEGTFSSSLIKFENKTLKGVRGKVRWAGDSLSLSNLQFDLYQGRVKGDFFTHLSTQEFKIDVLGERLDLSFLYPEFKGTLFFKLKGGGLLVRDLASGQFEIKDLKISPFRMTGIKGKVRAGYTPGLLSLKLSGNFSPGDNKVNISLNFPFKGKALSAEIKGNFNNLNLLLPWKGAEGRINYLAEIKSQKVSPQIKGVVDFKGSLLPLPGFAHAFRDYSGLVFVENNKVSLRSFKAKLGGGDVRGIGEISLGKGGVKNINLRMEGKRLLLSPLERTQALTDGTLNLIKDANRFLLNGEFLIHKLSWRREINEKIAFSSTPYYRARKGPSFFNNLDLNIHLKADNNAWIENSLGRIRGRFDLTIAGNMNAPIILGDIEALGGNVYFQDRKFKILRGRVSFFNPSIIEPYLNFKGETYVKNYRVNFSLNGFLDHLNPEFSSSPPLPPEDVLALLALGESFKRTYSYDTSTKLSTTSFLSFQLSEEAKKRAKRLFSIDRFRIDPFILGTSAEMTARLTVGKKISRNFIILYSTNLRSQREEIARLEWELTDDFSVVGIRDERGRFSIDVKFHRRF